MFSLIVLWSENILCPDLIPLKYIKTVFMPSMWSSFIMFSVCLEKKYFTVAEYRFCVSFLDQVC